MGMAVRFELFSEDTKRSVAFYKDILGFKKTVTDIDGDYYQLVKDTVQIGIGSIEKLQPEHYFRPEIAINRKGLGVEIVLEVDDITILYKAVRAKGYPMETPLTQRPWGLTDFRIVDPDGYYLRLTSCEL